MSLPVRLLHRFSFLRSLARRICRRLTLRQSFHGGRICLNAVEHSWAWTNRIRYETFDVSLQNCLLRLSRHHSWMVDIGANVGAMSLSVALRNPDIQILAVDPNPLTSKLLNQSIRINHLSERMRAITAAVAPTAEPLCFDTTGSVTGHVTETGSPVSPLTPAQLFEKIPTSAPVLIKCDIEGYETRLLPALLQSIQSRSCTLVIELHPQGLNDLADPHRCMELLTASGATLTDEQLSPLTSVPTDNFSSVVAQWNSSPSVPAP